ncbi:MAG: flagellar assembly peptidoglycan hydrolase FlgJ [Piscirickettsiaceae bacterium]|nr:flagellar assembly peptidoglycan hydrolase FlgJ [Piscirickettsiaceae bacterium]
MALNTHIAQTSLDFQGLAELRRSSNQDGADQQTIKQVAGQFEAIFINMMLKSMRQASLAEGIFDSNQNEMYREMSDQQLAMDLAGKGGGLGLQEAIIRQLGGQTERKSPVDGEIRSYGIETVRRRPALQVIERKELLQQVMEAAPSAAIEKSNDRVAINFDSPESFVQHLWPMAKQAADKLGVTPEVILAQAALETGWGKHVIKKVGEPSSYNLFNIKADSRWDGDSVAIGSVEYRDGVAVKEQSHFRMYESYQQSFDDYVNFIQTQPRYSQALEHSSDPEKFIEELHKAGYATDPSYTDKIKRIMNGATLAQISHQLQHS